MEAKRALIGVEFGEMTEILFAPGAIEGRVLTLEALQNRLREIVGGVPSRSPALKKTKDIDRALPRLVVATLVEAATPCRLSSRECERLVTQSGSSDISSTLMIEQSSLCLDE